MNGDFGVLGASNCFVIGENLRKQALSNNFNAAHSRKRKSFKIYETVKVNLIYIYIFGQNSCETLSNRQRSMVTLKA